MVEVGFQLAKATIGPRIARQHTASEGSNGVHGHVHGGTPILDLRLKRSHQSFVDVAILWRWGEEFYVTAKLRYDGDAMNF